MVLNVLAVLAGFALMMLGSYVLVFGASAMAKRFGVTDIVIGATVVALGTSLPELLAVVVSSWQGKSGIGLGNIVGSNIINVIGILGLGVLIMPITVNRNEVNPVTVIAFIAASCYLLWCLLARGRIGRMDGLVLVTAFVIYSWLSHSMGQASLPLPVGDGDAEQTMVQEDEHSSDAADTPDHHQPGSGAE
jgi:cation:H+ antiporter